MSGLREINLDEVKDLIEVVVLTVIDAEREEAERSLVPVATIVGNDKETGAGIAYRYCKITDQNGKEWHIALGQISGQGNLNSQTATIKALQLFKPTWMILCGIAGAAPEDEFTLGDVYLATHVHDLSVSAALEGNERSYRPTGGPLGIYTESLANNLKLLQSRLEGWNSITEIGRNRPTLKVPTKHSDEMFYGTEKARLSAHKSIVRHFEVNANRTAPKVVSGAAFSNNTLTKDTELLRSWRQFAKDASTVEMELAGAFQAIRSFGPNTGLLSVRGVSDVVGVSRSADWTEYASATAASLTKAIIKGGFLTKQLLAISEVTSPATRNEMNVEWFSKLPPYVEVMQFFLDEEFTDAVSKFAAIIREVCKPSTDLSSLLKVNARENFCESLVQLILNGDTTNDRIPIFGHPGSGKTSLIAVLALLARRRNKDANRVVEYVNLHDYDEIRGKDSDHTKTQVDEAMDRHIDQLKEVAEKSQLVLFVDGFDLHFRDRTPQTQNRFLRKLEPLRGVQVIGVGRFEEIERKYASNEIRAEKLPYEQNKVHIALNSISSDQVEAVCQRFVAFHKTLNTYFATWKHLKIELRELTSRVKQSGLTRFDLLRLDILATASKQDAIPFSAALDAYVKVKIEKQLDRESSDQNVDVASEMKLVAECLYRRWVTNEDDSALRFSVHCWGLLTGHPVMRSYFHAYHIVQTLIEIGRTLVRGDGSAVQAWKAAGLAGKIFPVSTNEHCKWLLKQDSNGYALSAIEEILSDASAPPFHKIHLAYLLGRIQINVQKVEKLLTNFYERSESIDVDANKTRMLQCTLLISLMFVSKGAKHLEYCDQFISALFDRDWLEVARGFHLMYYGDTDFQYDFTSYPNDHRDRLEPYGRVLDAIEPKLKAALNSKKPSDLFDVQVAMICALAVARQESSDTDWSNLQQKRCRERTRALLDLICENNSTVFKNRPVFPFARLVSRLIKSDKTTVCYSYLTKFYELKYDTQRAGWLKQLGIKGRIESVADHSWSAMLLAEALLPEVAPAELVNEGYRKSDIIRILLIHDLAESFTGDRPSDMEGQAPGGEHRSEERHLMENFAFLPILDGIGGFRNLSTRWMEVENRSTINGKIANYFDKVDAFVQLVVYSKYYFEQRFDPIKSELWVTFYDKLRAEVESAANAHRMLLQYSQSIVEWGDSEFNSDRKYLLHEELFSGINKYYPVPLNIGSRVELSPENHSRLSREYENGK